MDDSWPDAYEESKPRNSGEPPFTRVYRQYGRVAHLATAEGSRGILCRENLHDKPTSYTHAFPQDGWYGTGCQEEYDRAAELPLCRKCFAVRERLFYPDRPDPRLGAGHSVEMT